MDRHARHFMQGVAMGLMRAPVPVKMRTEHVAGIVCGLVMREMSRAVVADMLGVPNATLRGDPHALTVTALRGKPRGARLTRCPDCGGLKRETT